MICEKCGLKLSGPPPAENPSHALKNWLKKEMVDRSLWGKNRVVTTSCLDICPDGKVAVAFTSDRPDLEAWAEIVDPVTERDRILSVTIERVKPASKTR